MIAGRDGHDLYPLRSNLYRDIYVASLVLSRHDNSLKKSIRDRQLPATLPQRQVSKIMLLAQLHAANLREEIERLAANLAAAFFVTRRTRRRIRLPARLHHNFTRTRRRVARTTIGRRERRARFRALIAECHIRLCIRLQLLRELIHWRAAGVIARRIEIRIQWQIQFRREEIDRRFSDGLALRARLLMARVVRRRRGSRARRSWIRAWSRIGLSRYARLRRSRGGSRATCFARCRRLGPRRLGSGRPIFLRRHGPRRRIPG